VHTTTSDYQIFIPASDASDALIHHTRNFEMWITSNGDHSTTIYGVALPEAVAGTQNLKAFLPDQLSQKMVATASKWRKQSAIERPSALSAKQLRTFGYDGDRAETDPVNVAAIEEAIMSDPAGYEAYLQSRTALSLELVDLVYPQAKFGDWYDRTLDEEPLTAEFLLNVAASQCDRFLEGQSSLFSIVLPTDSIGDPSLTLEGILKG
jgi:hypothetical protein